MIQQEIGVNYQNNKNKKKPLIIMKTKRLLATKNQRNMTSKRIVSMEGGPETTLNMKTKLRQHVVEQKTIDISTSLMNSSMLVVFSEKIPSLKQQRHDVTLSD